jgi:thiamine-phosphate pyrophosphorylase
LLLYYITDRKQFPGDELGRCERLLQKIEKAARAGVDYIQLREKDLTSRELEQLAREAVRRVADTKSKLLINSRTDIALAVGAHGVHLRSDDVSPEDVRRVWRQSGDGTVPIIGASCHSEQEVIAARQAGADFVVFGPVFAKATETGVGLNALRSVCRHDIPVLALGGVTLGNARSCKEAGAAGVAGIRLFQENKIADVVKALRSV